jgi:hypothetical protein
MPHKGRLLTVTGYNLAHFDKYIQKDKEFELPVDMLDILANWIDNSSILK